MTAALGATSPRSTWPPVRGRWVLGLSAAALASMLSPAPATAETAAVGIADLRFTPGVVRAQMVQGEAGYPEAHAHVLWVNDEPAAEHTVTFDDSGLTSSGRLAPGDTFEVVLPAGTFTYRCTIHPAMKGTLVAVAPGTVAEATAEEKTAAGPPLMLVVTLLAGIAAVTVALRRRRRSQP